MSQPRKWPHWLTCVYSTLALLPHVFCCLLPIVLAVVGFFASGSLTMHHWLTHPVFVWIHQYHLWLLLTAFLSVSLSAFFLLKQKKKSNKAIAFVCATVFLLIVDFIIFMAEGHIFHVHHFRFH